MDDIVLGDPKTHPTAKGATMTGTSGYTPLTSENAAVLLVDHQVGLMTGVRDIDVAELKHNVVAMTRAAQVLGVPVIATTSDSRGLWGPTIPELAAVIDEKQIIDRSMVNAWDDERIRAAVGATGATKLIIAGVSLEVCAAFPAISAIGDGYDTYVAVDASGTFNSTKRETGLLRLQAAGAVVTDYATPLVEILKDNSRPVAAEFYAALDMPFAALVWQLSSATHASAA
jgi:nicotinamidase-related amidase